MSPIRILKKIQSSQWTIPSLGTIMLILIGAVAAYGYIRVVTLSNDLTTLSSQVASLQEELASTSNLLQENIAQTHQTLSQALNQERQNVTTLEQQLGSFQQEVGSISGTVTTLQKLSNTDPELLQKYSKVFFLNEHYTPERVLEISDEYKYFSEKHPTVLDKVLPYLTSMLGAAKNAGIDMYVFSAYRPFDEQQALKGQYTVTYGAGTANQFSADQGYSEHQLGTTVDLITTGIGGTLSGFEKTQAYQWLVDNAYRYGFVLSYPKDNSYYVFEPWHWRFVGIKLATDLHNAGKYFYDLDQREIDQYLVNIFD